ncbi:MAG TPA: hypothetical protein VMU75_04460 [Acidimicrobiales bacterium]|nr:hypothetical protein [Acidimicrobiales bacterium]
MARHPNTTLDDARNDAGLTQSELWMRYFELGGMASPLEVEAYLVGSMVPSPHDHEVLVHALNERFSELGCNHPVPHSDDVDDGAPPHPRRDRGP